MPDQNTYFRGLVNWHGNDLEIIPPKEFAIDKLNTVAAERTRSVIMLIGPLIHYLKNFSLPQAGGCKLGSRTVKPHLYALEKMGVDIKATENSYEVTVGKLTANEIVLYEAGDTVTENAIIAAAGIPGTTVIKYASANYMGQEVCFYLERLGVKIEGIGTTTLTVYGREEINTDVTYEVSEDPIESMFFIAAAILTGSSITIERCPIDFLEVELFKLEKMGFKYDILKKYVALNGRTNLVDIQTHPSKLTALEEKIESKPYPGLNIDNLPFFAVIATQATGTTFIHDWVYRQIGNAAVQSAGQTLDQILVYVHVAEFIQQFSHGVGNHIGVQRRDGLVQVQLAGPPGVFHPPRLQHLHGFPHHLIQ